MADADAWNEIQALKSKQNSFRAKLAARRKEREGLVAEISKTSTSLASASTSKSTTQTSDGKAIHCFSKFIIVNLCKKNHTVHAWLVLRKVHCLTLDD